MAPRRFDAYDAEFLRDPYPTYARLRAEAPFFDDEWGLTFFSTHADVTGMLRDKRFGRDIRHVLPLEEVDPRTYPVHLPNWYRMIRGSFIDLEPPDHTRIRGAVNRSFTKKRAEIRREEIRDLAESLLRSPVEAGEVDFIADYASIIPVFVIADLMGVPREDKDLLLSWSHAIVRVFDLNVSPEEQSAAETAVIEFKEYLGAVIDDREGNPGDDLISELAAGSLSRDDLIATCILVLNAGHEATVHAIGNGLLALARNPAQAAALASGEVAPDLATEELLRYDPPLQMFERWVLEDLEWEGVRLRRGDKVGLLFGAANHDPAAFTAPERLDLGRFENPHVSFGLGTHFCIGAPLARIEEEAALTAVHRLARTDELVDEQPPRTPSLVFRGVNRLQAEISAR